MSIYFRENFDVKIVNVKRAIDGRKILINVELNGYIFSLINIYAPNTGSKRSEFFKNLQCFITKHCLNDNILICGDFNCQLNDEKDKSVHILKKMIDKLRLTDLRKKNYSNLNGLTWCDAENNPKSRIDYILINENFCHKFSGLCIRKIPGTHSKGCRMSDHKFFKFQCQI